MNLRIIPSIYDVESLTAETKAFCVIKIPNLGLQNVKEVGQTNMKIFANLLCSLKSNCHPYVVNNDKIKVSLVDS